jgi:hypothetical protein
LDAEEVMPHRRRVQKGSFESHFDELVEKFPATDAPLPNTKRSPELQQKIDIHALLFERAWKLDQESST